MKKCYNCTHLTLFNECAHRLSYTTKNTSTTGSIQIPHEECIPITEMRSHKGQCGPEANLYSSKFLYELKLFTIFGLGLFITFLCIIAISHY